MTQLATGFKPQFLTTQEAARLLRVSSSTVNNWINKDTIPYVKLPGGSQRAKYLIPLRGLVNSLTSNYDLAGELNELVEAAQGAGVGPEEAVALAGGEPE